MNNVNELKKKQKEKRKTKKETKRKLFKNSIKGSEVDFNICVAITILILIGVVMVYSASSYYSLYDADTPYGFIAKHIIFAVAGLIIMWIISFLDYHIYKKLVSLILIAIVGLLVATHFLGDNINGATRWITIGPIQFQPSELVKYAVVVMMAVRLDNIGKKLDTVKGTLGSLILPGVFALAVLMQKSMSIAMVIAMVAFLMLFIAGGHKKTMITLLPVGLAGVFLMMILEPYRWERFITFLDPWKYTGNESYQLIHSLYALGTGGVTGAGLGNSMQKALYIPEPHNDFIFSIIGEELGLMGCTFVIAVFIYFIVSAFKVSSRAKDNYGKLLGIGITLIIAIQAIINIAVVTGSMPVTGVPLPFISYGGTALMINLAAVGILLNISRKKKVK